MGLHTSRCFPVGEDESSANIQISVENLAFIDELGVNITELFDYMLWN